MQSAYVFTLQGLIFVAPVYISQESMENEEFTFLSWCFVNYDIRNTWEDYFLNLLFKILCNFVTSNQGHSRFENVNVKCQQSIIHNWREQ